MPRIDSRYGHIHYHRIGDGWPLVLIHGNTYTAATQARLAHRFADEHSVYSIDLLGHGHSARPTGLFSEHYFTMQGAALADFLAAIFPATAVPLFGMSAGGISALNAACEQPARVAALILDGVFYQVSAATVAAHHQSRTTISPTWDRFMRQQHGSEWWPQLQDGIDAAIGRLAASQTSLVPCLGSINVPTLIFQGGRDAFVPDAQAYTIADHISGARLHYDPEAGHLLAWKDPAAFREMVRSFLRPLRPHGADRSSLFE
jgi:pimeloyl-ACP methyl ester carboxylesterase